MTWIKVRTNLATDPAVLGLAAILQITVPEAVGRLVAFWSWADQLTADGIIRDGSISVIDAIGGVTGFARALEQVGWLCVTPSGATIPNFDNHMSQSAKNRALTARRVKRHREKKSNDAVVTGGNGPSLQSNASSVNRGEERRGEERREEKKEENIRAVKDVDAVWDAYLEAFPASRLTAKRRQTIGAAIRKWGDVEFCRDAVRGLGMSDHHTSNGFTDPEYAFREKTAEGHAERWRRRNAPQMDETTRKNLEMVARIKAREENGRGRIEAR